jgi:hypothetical protein
MVLVDRKIKPLTSVGYKGLIIYGIDKITSFLPYRPFLGLLQAFRHQQRHHFLQEYQ